MQTNSRIVGLEQQADSEMELQNCTNELKCETKETDTLPPALPSCHVADLRSSPIPGDADTAAGTGSWMPDIVVSGINHGPNYGLATYYSGTVAGAREACFRGIKAISASLDTFRPRTAEGFELAASLLVPLVSRLLAEEDWPARTVLNVNIPCEDEVAGVDKFGIRRQGVSPMGLTIVQLGYSGIEDRYVLQTGSDIGVETSATGDRGGAGSAGNDFGGDWTGTFRERGCMLYTGSPADDDAMALAEGYMTVTPIDLGTGDGAAARAMQRLRDWEANWKHPALEWTRL